jgi:diaminopimelate decarboxylase
VNHFHYRGGLLHAEDVPLDRLAASVGTPFYCYSTATLERHFRVLQDAVADLDATICFAVKANSNIAVIRTLAALGAGADVVSEGELRRALAAGIAPEKIVFSGVGKTRQELELAIDTGILQINVESEPELEELNRVALSRGRRAVIGLRVNPDVDANTHAKITTGRKENKFGIEWTRIHQVLTHAQGLPGIDVASIAVHIGSQLTDLQPFRDAFSRLRDLILSLKADGVVLPRLDLGGGLGIPYDDQPSPSPADYAAVIRDHLGDLGCRLILEPGRMLVGNAGILVSRVIYVKEGTTRNFVICDAAMNDLVRPAMYDAYHAILPVVQAAADDASRSVENVSLHPVDVVGPICESGDTFAKQRLLPPIAKDDLIVFATAGAYGSAMSSTYNSRPLIPEVLVKEDHFAVVRARPTYEEMLALESLPPWL